MIILWAGPEVEIERKRKRIEKREELLVLVYQNRGLFLEVKLPRKNKKSIKIKKIKKIKKELPHNSQKKNRKKIKKKRNQPIKKKKRRRRKTKIKKKIIKSKKKINIYYLINKITILPGLIMREWQWLIMKEWTW